MILYAALFLLLAFVGGLVLGFYLGIDERFDFDRYSERRDRHE